MSVWRIVLETVFWGSVGWLFYIYWGYGALLRVLCRFSGGVSPTQGSPNDTLPFVTVLLTVHNEQRTIERRLENLLAQDYPRDRLDIVVVSDGSSDGTDMLVAALASVKPLRLVRTERLGKSGAQNMAMRAIGGDIVVLTDAEADFDTSCIHQMASAFADPTVGCVTAHLKFRSTGSVINESQGYYWRYELALRECESELGILAVASGQAMAFRRSLFRELPLFIGDDCVIPLDVVQQGYRVVHCTAAKAHDVMADDAAGEFRARVRMTTRNWTGTWRDPGLLNPLRHPGYAFALWSHKLLRWLGPLALIGMTGAAVGLAVLKAQLFLVTAVALFWTAGGIGLFASRRGLSLPIAGPIYSLVLANLAFLIGVANAAKGGRIILYGR